jgi:DNA-binding transcriptional ArsR family regulator
MHPKRIEKRSSPESNRPLPVQLAKSLEPEARQALMHGVRRRILRMLNQDPTPRTTQDLLETFPGLSLSSVTYHVLVLGECGSLTVSRGKAIPGSFTRLLSSNVVDDPQLVAVLRATESLDDVR